MTLHRFGFIGAAVVLITACSAHPIDRIESAQADVVDVVCGCAPEPSECRAQGSEAIACSRSIYEAYPDAYGPYAECFADALEPYAACLRDFEMMCDSATYDDCTDALNEALSACPPITSGEALAMLDACR